MGDVCKAGGYLQGEGTSQLLAQCRGSGGHVFNKVFHNIFSALNAGPTFASPVRISKFD